MTGGGFGGCVVALVARDKLEEVEAAVASKYEAATGVKPQIFVTQAVDGTAIV